MTAIWEATSQNVKYRATGGRGAPRYRLTTEHLHVQQGMIRTESRQVRTAEIIDVDVRQSMTQRAMGVGTVVVRARRLDDQVEEVELDSVPDPRQVQQTINDAAREGRSTEHRMRNVTEVHGGSTPTAPSAPPPPSGPPAGWYNDPHGGTGQRWWDGTRWTEHTHA